MPISQWATFAPAEVSWNCGRKYKHGGIFTEKRSKLLQLALEALSLEIDELQLNRSDSIFKFLHRLGSGRKSSKVDAHIQQLDQYMRKLEELRQERELASGAGVGASNADASARSRLAVEPPSVDLELPVDPNEPTYCFCNQVSYGEMVACDNPDCKIEWFHFGCVGLKEQPKGKWYCSNCVGMQKRRKGK
ncbi:PHD finger protein ING [Cocos nucifera]|uniref:PHD finger protein ING n=1 Tax=Cocos nucifera TaxID=13894 RepID=A0A8K0IMC2_COCNU|nr:PHD finger protein ING [Cocos nucifera]